MGKMNHKTVVSASRLNYNKLQAAACITSSAAFSIGLIYLAIKHLFY